MFDRMDNVGSRELGHAHF